MGSKYGDCDNCGTPRKTIDEDWPCPKCHEDRRIGAAVKKLWGELKDGETIALVMCETNKCFVSHFARRDDEGCETCGDEKGTETVMAWGHGLLEDLESAAEGNP